MRPRGGNMDTHLATLAADKYITVDGLRLRYIEE